MALIALDRPAPVRRLMAAVRAGDRTGIAFGLSAALDTLALGCQRLGLRPQGALLTGYVDGHLRATRPQTIGWRWVPDANDTELAHLEPEERARLLAEGAELDKGLMAVLREIEAASPQ
jgi:hypothetical protein